MEEITIWTIIAELGLDREVFQTPERAASWAAPCPGNRESAGKRRSGKTREGNRYLRRALIQSTWAISHSKDNYLRARYLCARYWRLAGKGVRRKPPSR